MARREFLMLGKPYNPDKHDISGFWMSEKLDGIRCYWDGGITRGIKTVQVPWAGIINPKTGQLKKKIKETATGLWSRYGNPIIAPEWFLNQLPACPLDGELYAGRGKFQQTASIVKKDIPIDSEWEKIKFAVFGTPNLWDTMQDGEIKNPQMICDINLSKIKNFLKSLPSNPDWLHLEAEGGLPFSAEIANLNEWLDPTLDLVYLVHQTKLPNDRLEAHTTLISKFRQIRDKGGEGLVLRDPHSVWTPKRLDNVLKVKACLDAEGILVGYTSGRKTNKGSKLLGKIGALILDFGGERLELAGLTGAEREFLTPDMEQYASDFPGDDMPEHFEAKKFKKGDRVTFIYRELSDDGIPKEARFDRVRFAHD